MQSVRVPIYDLNKIYRGTFEDITKVVADSIVLDGSRFRFCLAASASKLTDEVFRVSYSDVKEVEKEFDGQKYLLKIQ